MVVSQFCQDITISVSVTRKSTPLHEITLDGGWADDWIWPVETSDSTARARLSFIDRPSFLDGSRFTDRATIVEPIEDFSWLP